MEIKDAAERLKGLEDPQWTGRGTIQHRLEDIVIIGLYALICGSENFSEMEEFEKEKEEGLRKFLTLSRGIPDIGTFRWIFEKLNIEAQTITRTMPRSSAASGSTALEERGGCLS